MKLEESQDCLCGVAMCAKGLGILTCTNVLHTNWPLQTLLVPTKSSLMHISEEPFQTESNGRGREGELYIVNLGCTQLRRVARMVKYN